MSLEVKTLGKMFKKQMVGLPIFEKPTARHTLGPKQTHTYRFERISYRLSKHSLMYPHCPTSVN